MKFALITERKNPPDKRVVFSPQDLKIVQQQFPQATFVVESSDIRVFTDDEYRAEGFEVANDVSDCDVLIGVKEVPVEALIAGKTYFFFSHTIKKQPHNRKLLQAIVQKNIRLIDHETIVKPNGVRLIGFGRYAGIVGAYNGFRTWGLKFRTWNLPKANTLYEQQDLINELNTLQLPSIKILLTGNGKVASGAKEMLDAMHIKQVDVEAYLTQAFDEAVYCKVDVLDYNKRKDGRVVTDNYDFYNNPQDYESDFMRFAKVTDLYMAGHFYGNDAPYFYTKDDVKHADFNIKVVADISCDVEGPIATTLRSSTIADPIYGYDPQTSHETNYMNTDAIAVMAVDNLPCELPKDASEGFGKMFMEHVIPAFFNDDADGVLARATITENGQLLPKFAYLQDYVDGK